MTCEELDERLGDFVDGTMPAAAREAVAAHLEFCAGCRALAVDFRAIRAAALTLEPHLPPARVWAAVSAAIEAAPRRSSFFGGWFAAWQPVAAAAMGVVLAASLWSVGDRLSSGVPRPGAAAAGTTVEVVTADSALRDAEHHFTTEIAGLEQITDAQKAALDPNTASVVQANLTVIDQAIGESRAALETQPGSDVARESLFDALRSKVILLQDTLALINEMRKGNPEGAARIASGLNP